MAQKETGVCPECGKPLAGVVEIIRERRGVILIIVQRKTNDCNWNECAACREVFCKSCCVEGRCPESLCRRCWKQLLESAMTIMPTANTPANQQPTPNEIGGLIK